MAGDTQILDLELGALNLAVSDHDAADGTLRELENLCYVGPEGAHNLSPVETPTDEFSITGETIVAVGRQVRQRRGDFSSQSDSGLERFVVVTGRAVHLVDPDNNYRTTEVYAFSQTDTTRKAQFAMVGAAMLIAVSAGAGCGGPDELLLLEDDELHKYEVPVPEDMSATPVVSHPPSDDPDGPLNELTPGEYGYRFAFLMQDGTYSAPTTPRVVDADGIGSSPSEYPLGTSSSAGSNQFAIESGTQSDLAMATYRNRIRDAKNAGIPDWDGQLGQVGEERVDIISVSYDSGSNIATFTIDGEFAEDHANTESLVFPNLSHLRFDVNSISIPSGLEDRIKGIACLVSPQLTSERNAMQATYYHVADITTLDNTGQARYWERKENIPSYPQVVDDNLAQHQVAAGTVFSYNSRFLLGDVSYDFVLPDASVVNTGTAETIRIGVRLKTTNGTFERIGPEIDLDAASVEFEDNLLAYPDVRAYTFRIYLDDGTGTLYLAEELDAKEAGTVNVAYHKAEGAISLTAGADEMPNVDDTNGELDADPNRVIYTEPYKPLALPADHVQYVGTSADDRVLGFAVTSAPVSQGQWGQYPILVLCKESLHALEVGAEPFILSATVVDGNTGIVGRYGFVNVEGTIFAATAEGVYTLTPRLSGSPVSAALHRSDGQGDIVSEMDCDTCLAYFTRPERDRREMWVSTGVQTYALSLRHGAWFTMDRTRSAYARMEGTLYGASGAGVSDEAGSTAAVSTTLRTSPIDYGAPFTRKRIRRVGVRQADRLDEVDLELYEVQKGAGDDVLLGAGTIYATANAYFVPTPRGHSYESYLSISAQGTPGQALEGFEVYYTYRQTHHRRT